MMTWLRPMLARVLAHLSMVLTLAGLAGLAWLGHRHDWKVPSYASLWGPPEAEDGQKSEESSDAQPGKAARPPAPPPQAPSLKTIQLDSPGTADRARFEFAPVQLRAMSQQVRGYGMLDYDQTHYAQLSSRVPGRAWRVLKGLGDRVSKGDTLALVESAEVGKAKAEFLQAMVQVQMRTLTLDRLRAVEPNISAKTMQDAESALREANIKLLNDQQALVNLGLPVSSRGTDQPDPYAVDPTTAGAGLAGRCPQEGGTQLEDADGQPAATHGPVCWRCD